MGNTQYEKSVVEVVLKAKSINENQIMKAINLANQMGLTGQQVINISSLNAWQMVQKLNSGTLTSLVIILSMIVRTSTIGKKLCLFTQTNFDYAIEAAQRCDQMRRQSGKKNWTMKDGQFHSDKHLPPLYGIPISIKDTYNVDGLMTTIGLASRTNSNRVQQSPLITCFKNSGMIPFVKSNVPQFGMAIQSVNNIWGRSLNPWNLERATGGSSGGQAGLIASRCSVLGLGSDIGGSIRIPSQFCGIFGFKPFSKRISSSYHAKLSDAFSGLGMSIPLCIGPLSRSAQDMAYFFKVATTQEFYGKNFDYYQKNIQFNEAVYLDYSNLKVKKRIGYFTSLKDIEPTSASIRAVNQIVSLLSQQGHECVKIQIPNQQQIIRQFLRQNLGTKGETYRQILSGQQPIKQYASLFQIAEMSGPMKGVAKYAGRQMMPRISYYFLENGQMSGYEYQKHLGMMENYRRQWVNYWKSNNLDFVIAPGFGCQALPHGKSQKTALAVAYTFIWNVLDMAVGSMPVTVVKDSQQDYSTAHEDMLADELRQVSKNSVGLPVGVQVVGLPYEQEKVLGLMSLLERQVQFYGKHQLPNLQ